MKSMVALGVINSYVFLVLKPTSQFSVPLGFAFWGVEETQKKVEKWELLRC